MRIWILSFCFLMFWDSSHAQTHYNESADAQLDLNKIYRDMQEAVKTADSEAPFTYEASQARRLARGGVTQGVWINVDTRDQEACREVYQNVRYYRTNHDRTSLEDFCHLDPARPMMTVVVFDEINAEEFRRDLSLSSLKTTDKNMVTDTRNLALTMVGTMGILWMLPESVTKWNKEEIRQKRGSIFHKYVDNIKKGPVVDRDDPIVNWIGHPISGAAYYTLARHNNLSMMQSFGYSVMMSTFFWEYGFEAPAEVPSIQDLIITPVVGSILGELFYRAELHILANDGKLAGSKKLGKLAMVVLNPMGAISNGVNGLLGSKVIQNAEASIFMRREDQNGMPVSTVGVQLRFVFY